MVNDGSSSSKSAHPAVVKFTSHFGRPSIKVGVADDLDSGGTYPESGGADLKEIVIVEENNITSNGTPSANANTWRANELSLNWALPSVELGEDSVDYSAYSNLCRSLPDHLDAAPQRLSDLEEVLQLFDKDKLVGSKEYNLALEGIMKFRQSGQLFREGLVKLFPPIYEKQKLMSNKLEAKMFKLEKKLRLIKFWGKVLSLLTFIGATVLGIYTVLGSRITFPMAVKVIMSILSIFIAGGVGKFVDSLISNYEEKLTKKLDIIDSVKSKNSSMLKIIQDIHALVDDLLSEMEPLYSTDVFVRDREALVLAMDKMKKALTESTQKIENLSRHAYEFCGGAQRLQNMILQDIGATSST